MCSSKTLVDLAEESISTRESTSATRSLNLRDPSSARRPLRVRIALASGLLAKPRLSLEFIGPLHRRPLLLQRLHGGCIPMLSNEHLVNNDTVCSYLLLDQGTFTTYSSQAFAALRIISFPRLTLLSFPFSGGGRCVCVRR